MSARSDRLKSTIDELERKHAEAERRKGEIAAERETCSFAANTGSKNAAARLATLHDEALRIGLEIEDLAGAITSGKAQLAAAQADDAAAAVRAKARQAQPIVEKLRTDARLVGVAIAQLTAALAEIKADFLDVNILGIATPGGELVSANLRRALDAALMPVGLHRSIVPSSQRVEIAALFEAYARGMDAEIAKILGEKAA